MSNRARSEATGAGLTSDAVGWLSSGRVPRWLRDRRAGRQARGRVSDQRRQYVDGMSTGVEPPFRVDYLREYSRQDPMAWARRLLQRYRDTYPEVYEAVRLGGNRAWPNISISPDDGETEGRVVPEIMALADRDKKAERIRQAWLGSPTYDPDAVGQPLPPVRRDHPGPVVSDVGRLPEAAARLDERAEQYLIEADDWANAEHCAAEDRAAAALLRAVDEAHRFGWLDDEGSLYTTASALAAAVLGLPEDKG